MPRDARHCDALGVMALQIKQEVVKKWEKREHTKNTRLADDSFNTGSQQNSRSLGVLAVQSLEIDCNGHCDLCASARLACLGVGSLYFPLAPAFIHSMHGVILACPDHQV